MIGSPCWLRPAPDALLHGRIARRFANAALATLFASGLASALARDIHVPGDQPTIQQGVSAARPGDRVLVAPGLYDEQVGIDVADVQVIGLGGAAVTLIDGAGACTVVGFGGNTTRKTVLSGFTIQNGICAGEGDDTAGGGVSIGGSPTLTNNVIRGNFAYGGAGIAVFGGSPHIHHNVIRNNTTDGPATSGTGIYLVQADEAIVEDNLIEHNGPVGEGGGISVSGLGHPVIRRNILRDNVASYGGAIYSDAPVEIDGNLAAGNSAYVAGGGLYLDASYSSVAIGVVNNTLADNAGDSDLEIHTKSGGTMTLANNLVRTSLATSSITCNDKPDSPATFAFTLVHANNGADITGSCDVAGGGLVTDDPLFQGGKGARQYKVRSSSPAIDAGSDAAAAALKRDLAGKPRVQGKAVDIGAYEARPD